MKRAPQHLLFNILAIGVAAMALTSHAAPSRERGLGQGRAPRIMHEYSLPSFSLVNFGYSQAEVDAAQANGLAITDLPGIGSGLEHLKGNHYLSVTDRGPNGDRADGFKFFPLPQFTPTIVLFELRHDRIEPEAVLPIVNDLGEGVTGIPNAANADTTPFLTATSPVPLPFNPDGMDVEDVHTLKHGGFILVEEYTPSVVIVGDDGHVLRRYTPAGKTLPGAHYTVSDTLPGVFGQRRNNRAFEVIAVSDDGNTAYTMTQSPMGSTSAGSVYRDSSLVRIIRMDIRDPLNLQVTGMFLFKMLAPTNFPAGNAARDLKISGADTVSRDKLLILQGTDKLGAGGHKVVLVDLTGATDVLTLPDASAVPLVYENVLTDFAALGITLAETEIVADLINDLPEITERKLEGLTILNRNEIVISSDNDFGLGDVLGELTKVYTIRLGAPLR